MFEDILAALGAMLGAGTIVGLIIVAWYYSEKY